MKKYVFLFLFSLLPTSVMSQASGGHVTRPAKNQQDLQNSGSTSSKRSYPKVIREVYYESTLSAEKRKVWEEEKAKARERMKLLASNLKMQQLKPEGNFYNGLARCNRGYIDKNGNLVIKSDNFGVYKFHSGYAKIQKGRKWGVIDKKGDVIIPMNYDWVGDFSEGVFCVQQRNQIAYINEKDVLIIPFMYNEGENFSEGYAGVCKDRKWGYIDKIGNVVIPFEYDRVSQFKEGLAPVEKNGKWGYIDINGKTVIPFVYDHAYSFNCGLGRVEKNGKEGFVNEKGEVVIPVKYGCKGFAMVNDFKEDIVLVGHKQSSNNRWGYMNKQGKYIIIPQYYEAEDFSEGLACVAKRNSMNQCKYGFINKKGEIVIPFKFVIEHIDYEFSEGMAYIEIYRGRGAAGKIITKGGFVDIYGNSTFDFE